MNAYVFQGIKRDAALQIAGVTKHQYYHRPTHGKRGRKPSATTVQIKGDKVEVLPNSKVVEQIKETHKDPDKACFCNHRN